MRTVLITGAGGFIGGHVVREAAARPGICLGLLSHRRPVPSAGSGHRVVPVDLTDPRSLKGVCAGADVLLHCASYVGPEPETNEAVNAEGTRNLVAEARRSGVSRIVYVSTASVYGRGTFRDAAPEELVRAPGSPTSASRAAAEDAVLEADGIVLRPHLVHGAGDVWVVPGLVALLSALPGDVKNWPALLSVVSARELGRLVVGTGLAPAADLTRRTYHAAHPVPVAAGRLLGAVARYASVPRRGPVLTVADAQALLAESRQATHVLGMLATDHWFDADPLWRDLRLEPGPDFDTAFADSASWYHRDLFSV
ncbi:NAD-dependent epimerase/dehydratase family protein [Streptomyces sp. LaPpAH-108]|uniref:NAD-dependent epimerase/dehydratase family protein n=1 Tax=Streptomyces sp. LaPpAH-108 TaxID=1155714 RepID=UPI00035F921C|nr:NAD-dependent epimerase/dehydratase family protein [Streptomyces sp. LaPpAH-108]